MKKAIIKSIEIGFFGVLFLLTSFSILAQPTIVEPGDKSVDSSLLNTGKFTWGYRTPTTAQSKTENFVIVQRNDKEITIEVRETDKRGLDVGKRVIVLNAKTFEPIRSSYKGEEVSYNLQYGTRFKVSGDDYTTNKKHNVDEPMNGKYFDIDSLDFVISTLPLSLNYRVTLPVVRLARGFKPEYVRYQIADVVELRDHSCVSGVRDMWIVKAVDKKNGVYRYLNIDKQTRRILRSRIHWEDADNLATDDIWDGDISWDKETDVNPIKTPFNVAEVRAMLTTGTSIIKGQAFTTDEAPKGALQRSKKQFAPKGSIVMLYPNTQYFKDWFNYNVGLQKLETAYFPDQGYSCKIQLPPIVREQSLLTEVTDDKGNFVFQNLKPGEYIVGVSFVATKYSHTTSTPTGYSVTVYPDGTASGGTTYDVRHWGSKENVLNLAYVKVKKDGEEVKVKLDK